jgi:hypothetical protein
MSRVIKNILNKRKKILYNIIASANDRGFWRAKGCVMMLNLL